MQRIIGGLRYDTSTATKVASVSKNLDFSSSEHSETLYRTEKGNWFLHKEGLLVDANWETKKEDIQPLSPSEAQDWSEKHDEIAALEAHFKDQISDA